MSESVYFLTITGASVALGYALNSLLRKHNLKKIRQSMLVVTLSLWGLGLYLLMSASFVYPLMYIVASFVFIFTRYRKH